MTSEKRYFQVIGLPAFARGKVATLLKQVLGTGSWSAYSKDAIADKIPTSILTTRNDPAHPETFGLSCPEGYKMEMEESAGALSWARA